jgi:hypothetical protein
LDPFHVSDPPFLIDGYANAYKDRGLHNRKRDGARRHGE